MSDKERTSRTFKVVKTELTRIAKGSLEFRLLFFIYLFILFLSTIFLIISLFNPTFNELISASKSTPWGIVTSIFGHSSFSHYALNMVGLFLFTAFFAFINSTYDHKTKGKMQRFFVIIAFVSAAISNIIWIILSNNGSIGASGLVYSFQGILIAFSILNGLQILYFKKFLSKRFSVQFLILMNIVLSFALITQIVTDANTFLAVGQGVNVIAHGVSFLLGLFVSSFWYYIIEKLSILS